LKTKVLRHSHFGPDAWGDGGSKRTAQISEILVNCAVEEEFYQPDITEIYQKKFPFLITLLIMD
jgi:hypothetical protein